MTVSFVNNREDITSTLLPNKMVSEGYVATTEYRLKHMQYWTLIIINACLVEKVVAIMLYFNMLALNLYVIALT
jgi:hypothetical protein